MEKRELDYLELKNYCDERHFDFATTDELEPLESIIGQERAVNAFDFGLRVKMTGYNIYMSGPSGTGKTTYASLSTRKIAESEQIPKDWCYVYNFQNPKSPIALSFEPGMGKQFRDDMNELISVFNTEIQKAFNSDEYEKQKGEINKGFEEKRDDLMKEMTDMAKGHGFTVKNTNSGIYFMPVVGGETINEEEYEKLDEKVKVGINESSDLVQEAAASIMRDIRSREKASKKALEDLDYKVCMFAIGHYVNAVQEKYKDYPEVLKHLEAVSEDVLDNISEFLDDDGDAEDAMSELLPMFAKKNTEDITTKYRVNLIIDNSATKGAPVIIDYNPTFYNLIGEVEYDNEFGNLTTDFMKIKGGLLHKANGGYLIVQAQDLLSNVLSWEALRRVLKTKEITIESLREQLGGIAMPTLKPEPIPVSLKVILIGSSYYYDILREYDDEFAKLFKIRADFDYEMDFGNSNILMLARFIKSFSLKEEIGNFDVCAVARVAEYSSRLVERRDKLSTCFNQIGEILCEATVWAQMEGDGLITKKHIDKAIDEKEKRLNMYEEKYVEMLDSGVILIDTQGEKIGQINGLAVLDTGDCVFGNPTRITATAYMGKSGIINIEKEADMSGPTHNKGVLVITGYLGQKYAQDFPLSLSCRICFEQNYYGIDGDSASSTELYCILSSLGDLPVKQNLAVTGSVNQRGEIQAIGGVTYKVEGFFELCQKRGLTGDQGVIIPATNIKDLVLKDKVVDAVRDGKFHIYPISTIDEGIELLTGVPAGKRDASGNFPEESVHGRVMKKLSEYNRKSVETECCGCDDDE